MDWQLPECLPCQDRVHARGRCVERCRPINLRPVCFKTFDLHAQQSVESAGLKFQGDLFIRDKRAKPLGNLDELKARRLSIGRTWPHEIAVRNAWEFETAPKTPPCIFIICRAAR